MRLASSRIFELIKDGVLPSVTIGRSRRIRRQDLAAYVAGLRHMPAPVPKPAGEAHPAPIRAAAPRPPRPDWPGGRPDVA